MGPEIFAPLGFFTMIVLIVYYSIRKKERMKLLEYGKDASVFATRRPGNAQIRYGVLLVFLGIAFLVANQLHEAGVMDEEPAYFSMLSLGAGLALIIGHFLERHDLRNRKKNEEDQA